MNHNARCTARWEAALSTHKYSDDIEPSHTLYIYITRGKGPTDGGHTGTEKRSTRRSTQTDTPGPAAATPTWNNTGPRWTGGGPDTTPETATDEAGGHAAFMQGIYIV